METWRKESSFQCKEAGRKFKRAQNEHRVKIRTHGTVAPWFGGRILLGQGGDHDLLSLTLSFPEQQLWNQSDFNAKIQKPAERTKRRQQELDRARDGERSWTRALTVRPENSNFKDDRHSFASTETGRRDKQRQSADHGLFASKNRPARETPR